MPGAQRLEVGAVVAPDPLASPQVPLTMRLAMQGAVALVPTQFQVQGPLPDRPDGVPAWHCSEVPGVLVKLESLADPQTGVTAVSVLALDDEDELACCEETGSNLLSQF
jgi:hypothetical protein